MKLALFLVIVGGLIAAVLTFLRRQKEDTADDGAATGPDQNAPEATAGMAKVNWLVGDQGEVVGKTFLIGTRAVTVGRATTNLVQLKTGDASRVHCQIRPTAKGLLLTDLKSANGTFVNGTRVREYILKEGDKIRVGDAILVYREKVDAGVDHALGRKEAGAAQAAETRLEGGQGLAAMISDALRASGGDQRVTAQKLGLTVEALRELMAKNGINP